MNLQLFTGINRPTPHLREFVEYYKAAGVTKFNFTSFGVGARETADKVEKLCPGSILGAHPVPCEPFDTQPWCYDLIKYEDPDTWCLIPDLDEFIDPMDLAFSMKETGDYIVGRLCDRIAESRKPEAYDPQRTLFEQYPLHCDITERMLKKDNLAVVAVRGGTEVLIRQSLRFGRQHPDLTYTANEVSVAHFKWQAGIEKVLQERADQRSRERQRYNWLIQMIEVLKSGQFETIPV